MRLTKNKLLLSILISLVIASALSILFLIGALSDYNIRSTDGLYGGKVASEDIVIIGIDDKSLQEIGRWPWDRKVHAQLLDKMNGSPAIVAFDVSFFEPSADDKILEKAINDSGNVILVAEYTKLSGNVGEELLVPVFDGIYDVGFANIQPGVGGVVRSVPAQINGVETLKPLGVVVSEYTIGQRINFGEKQLLINYVGPPGSFTRYSYSDVLNGRINSSQLENKIVLIGATATDLRDIFLTPVSNRDMPGVEVHANIVQTILAQDFLEYENPVFVVITLFVLSVMVSLLLYRLKIILATTAAIIIALVYFFLIAPFAFGGGVIVNLLYPLLAIAITYITHLAIFYVHEAKQRRKVTSIFGKYVSKEVASEILKKNESDAINLKGQKNEITVFFSDIRGFTTLSEKLTPEGLVKFLNKYLSAMTDVILEHRGVVDKYIGDAIMAFWGAPLKEKNHARLACEACLAQKKRLEEMKMPGLAIGMGVNTGPAIVGNMGSLQRVNYTAIGDTVNTAARLEGMTKEYGVHIIIGESTYAQVSKDFVCRELDMIKVKGKNIPVRIYELIDKKGGVDEHILKMTEHYSLGLNYYRKGKWNEAAAEFRKSIKSKDNKAAHNFIERCAYLKRHTPEKWDGVWTMTHK